MWCRSRASSLLQRGKFHLNDHINRPDDAAAAIFAAGAAPLIPIRASAGSRASRMTTVRHAPPLPRPMRRCRALPLRPPGDSVPLGRLERESPPTATTSSAVADCLVDLLWHIPLLGAPSIPSPSGSPICDLHQHLHRRRLRPGPARGSVTMHSNHCRSSSTIPFGVDTLTVNRRFGATPEGVRQDDESAGNESLDAIGLAVFARGSMMNNEESC